MGESRLDAGSVVLLIEGYYIQHLHTVSFSAKINDPAMWKTETPSPRHHKILWGTSPGAQNIGITCKVCGGFLNSRATCISSTWHVEAKETQGQTIGTSHRWGALYRAQRTDGKALRAERQGMTPRFAATAARIGAGSWVACAEISFSSAPPLG